MPPPMSLSYGLCSPQHMTLVYFLISNGSRPLIRSGLVMNFDTALQPDCHRGSLKKGLPKWVRVCIVCPGTLSEHFIATHLLPFIGSLWIKCGDKGLVYASRVPSSHASHWRNPPEGTVVANALDGSAVVLYYAAASALDGGIVGATGAGDTLVAALASMLLQCADEPLNPTAVTTMARAAQKYVYDMRLNVLGYLLNGDV